MDTATCTVPVETRSDVEHPDRLIQRLDLGPRALPDAAQIQRSAVRDRTRDRLDCEEAFEGFTGRSPALRAVLQQIRQVALTDSTVLLCGETGSGKELLATQVHRLGARRVRPMVKVNCSAIPETLIESELFGRERGAFTGALSKEIGLFELADRSTIFLDEIGDLASVLQVKLLRVLEEKKISRLGSPRPINIDTRIIAATHRNLEQRVADGLFREDLYYRLNVFPIHVPPLRNRSDDIPLLVWRFTEAFSKSFGKPVESISAENMRALQQYAWPGNVRELRNVVERAMIMYSGGQLTIPVPSPTASRCLNVKLLDVERAHIQSVLESTGWRLRGDGGAAEQLGLTPRMLENRMIKFGLTHSRSAVSSSTRPSAGDKPIANAPPASLA